MRDAITRAREFDPLGAAVLDLEGRYENRPGAQPPAPRFSAMLSMKGGAVREQRRRHKRVATAAFVSAAVVLFATLGGAGLAQTARAPAQGLVTQNQSGGKVEICHKGRNTISVSVNAVPAHLGHGDTESVCAIATQATDATGSAKAKKGKKSQSTESAQTSATGKTKVPKEKGVKGASAAGSEKVKPGKSESKKAAAQTPAEMTATAPKTMKLKKLKPTKSKRGSVSPPGLGGASPPGHANGKGNGKNK